MAAQHVAVRLNPGILGRVDALMSYLSTPWRPARRSDVLRALLLRGLEVIERERGATGEVNEPHTEPSGEGPGLAKGPVLGEAPAARTREGGE